MTELESRSTDYIIAIDENLAGAIPFLEYVGYKILRPERGQGDKSIHDFLNNLNEAEQVVFFSRDRDFTKYHDRAYFLYFLNLSHNPAPTQMETAQLIEMILDRDLPRRDDPQFEISIRHIFRTTGQKMVEVECAKPHVNNTCPKCNDTGWWDSGHDINGDLVICPAPCEAGRRELAKEKAKFSMPSGFNG